jgi:hypothetical protein
MLPMPFSGEGGGFSGVFRHLESRFQMTHRFHLINKNFVFSINHLIYIYGFIANPECV